MRRRYTAAEVMVNWAMRSAVLCEVTLPHVYLQRIDSVPSSSHRLIKFGCLGNRGTLLGQSACVLCRISEAIKAHQLGLREAAEHGGFPTSSRVLIYLFDCSAANEVSNHSLYRLGWFSLHPQMPEALRSWWQPRGLC